MVPAADCSKLVPRLGFARLIYVVGGIGDGGVLSKVELYDPQDALWTQLASMTDPRSLHGCVALEGKLYAVGGWRVETQVRCSTRRRYTTRRLMAGSLWPICPLHALRTVFGLAAVGGKIYATGGWNGATSVVSAEAYDPQLNSWALVAGMSVKRRCHASVVLDGNKDLRNWWRWRRLHPVRHGRGL